MLLFQEATDPFLDSRVAYTAIHFLQVSSILQAILGERIALGHDRFLSHLSHNFQSYITYMPIYIYIYTHMYILTTIWVSRDSSVGIATGYGLGRPRGRSSCLQDQFWGTPSLLFNGYLGLCPRG
jgi:hypothetical protein